MSEIKLKYNSKKIILFIILTIIMIVFFMFLHLNANELSFRKVGTGKNSWVGHLFYNRDGLLSITSLLIILLFSYYLICLTKLLFKKSLIIKIESNYLYVNKKRIESLLNIKDLKIVEANNNKFIYFNYYESRNRKIAKYFPTTIMKWFKIKQYILNLTFIKGEPNEVCNQLMKIIK